MVASTLDSLERAEAMRHMTDDLATDPLAAVISFGSRAVRTGLAVGIGIATISHGALGARALASSAELRHWAEQTREEIHAYLWSSYDIDLAKPEAPKPEPPKPEEKPEPEQPTATMIKEAAPKAAPVETPPPPAQAGKVLTAPSDPNEPVDLTGNGFVQGEADQYVGGVTAAAGTASAAVYNPAARVGGKPGGMGTGPVTSAPTPTVQGPDLSRPPGIGSSSSWTACDFPPEADVDQVDYAVAVIVVTVRADGSPMSVKVLTDPGHGFGRAARMCALSKRYSAALDHDGNATVGTTPPIHVTFTR